MKLYVILSIILCFSCTIHAQIINNDPIIEFGPKNLKMDEPFTISVVVPGEENRPSVSFPEINGLEKRSKSATSSINTVGGEKVVVQTISQQYFALKEGTYVIPSFFVTVNGLKIKSEGVTVEYNARVLINPEVISEEDLALLPEVGNNDEDVFLSVGANKKSVFMREGFALGISLYVAENAPIQMDFYQVNIQLQLILKKIRPVGCWEENVGIEEIIKRRIEIGGRKYTEFNLYQAQFFPMTLQDIIFPSVTLEMLVGNGKAGEGKLLKSFRSKVVKVSVKPLPPHPLKDQVAVGQYKLVERLSSALVYPGESIRYLFRIEGKGNIAAIPTPEIIANSSFDFYPPDISQLIKRSNQNVSGEKSFDYFVVPRQDGTFPLGRYFQWVYFDPKAAKYDTLISQKTLQVKGEDYKLGNISLHGSSGLYDNLERLDSSAEYFDFKQILKELTNAIVILLLLTMVWVLRK
ncbi:BatD family protein [Dyadobacter subterraneus]|uniref:BatD family protein n=1 Tax=Dyadobacter subterraneus TaxID=2773304 RepID=A0ABR9WL65_9BACT|nr:BatD family protein [Dyadobacter subterraneus]MBE9466172.1 BatD family protein [Dyadobacter subterraneus]